MEIAKKAADMLLPASQSGFFIAVPPDPMRIDCRQVEGRCSNGKRRAVKVANSSTSPGWRPICLTSASVNILSSLSVSFVREQRLNT